MSVYRTTCKVGACEPFCGLEVEVQDGRMVAVRPDARHPVTAGYVCIKGMRVPDYQNDPDRLLHPIRRGSSGWERVPWDAATTAIGRKLRAIRDAHGPRSLATYWGNAADSVSISLANTFCHAFGSPNSFNVLSLEYTDRGAVAARVLGNENLILQPDASRAKFALLLGTNPLVTNGMTLLQRRPRIAADIKAIQRGGGKVVVVDPRRTETVRVADEHVPIRPGTDLFLLVGMLRRIIETGGYDRTFVARHVNGFEAWAQLTRAVDLERVAEVTGLPRALIEKLADEFAAADGAFATTRVGVQTSHNTTLTEWAVMTLNAITGNIDRPGGVYFNPGALDVPALIERFSRRRNPAPSRIGRYPQIFGGPPATVFADDVLSDDPDRIRALVVVAGNPVITFPHTARVEAALRRLELLVCVDLYVSDTASFAHYVLPAATLYEKGGLHFLTSNFEPYPFLEWRPKVVEPRGEARGEWDIFKSLSRAAGVPFLNDPLLDRLGRALDGIGVGFNEDLLYRYLLIGKLGLGRLRRTPGGVKVGDIRWGEFLARGLHIPDRRLCLAPPEFVEALPEALATPVATSREFPFSLISGARRLASYNSWTHNVPALMDKMKGNWATLNPADAARLGIEDGQRVRVTSAVGSVEIGAATSADIKEGVVAIHQFWGHTYESGMRTARRYPGVNVNFLHGDRVRDRFSGMPVFNGTPCRVEPIAETVPQGVNGGPAAEV
jgi:anaerobic selenocysteine-containing dehydrogenase